MATFLTLGPILFADFEIPDTIKGIGGEQMLVVHKLPGGVRVVDAMGRDDADPKWSGRFRGSAAETRARLADYLRIQGQPIPLAFSTYRYTVLIKSFEADYNQPYEIPYSITLTVVSDDTTPIINTVLGVDAAVGSDLNNVVQIAAALNLPGVTTAVIAISTATADVDTFEGAGASVVTGVQGAISTALSVTGINIAANNSTVAASGSVAGVVAGGDPASLSSSLTAQASSFSALGQLYQLQSSLQRMATNVENASS